MPSPQNKLFPAFSAMSALIDQDFSHHFVWFQAAFAKSASVSSMPTYEVIVRANEPKSFEIKADKYQTGGAGEERSYTFFSDEKIVAWFVVSQVVGIIDKDSQ
ncbi:MAG: hypothetical protein JOZ08_08265 [Verrucomicrobia bacterium]|nr:hypothetical protein [Verrucomicrobiota bacterium]